jgi:hypothetical protein
VVYEAVVFVNTVARGCFSVSNSSKALCTFVLTIFPDGVNIIDEAGRDPQALVVCETIDFL